MRNKNFIIIVIGQIISLFGNAIQRFCMSLYILNLTGSAGVFSTILAISTIPYVLFAPIAGFLADTVNRKKIMVYLDFVSSVLMGFYGIILMSGRDNTIIVGIVMFMLSVIYTLYSPAVTASIPQIIEKEKLPSANGIIQQVGYVVNLLGPVLGGILYSFIGIKLVVIINAISFLICAILELFLNIPDLEIREKFKNPILKSIKEMKKSFIYLKERKTIVLGIIVSYALTNIFVVPILSVVTPYFINIQMSLPSSMYGFIEAIFVAGMIIGGMAITFRPKLFSVKKLHKTMYPMVIALIIMGIAVYLNAENKFFILGLYSFGGFGIMLSLALSNIISLNYIQQEVRGDMLGKVSAFSTAVATVSVPPGQMIFGQLIDFNFSLFSIVILTTISSVGVVYFIKWNVRKA